KRNGFERHVRVARIRLRREVDGGVVHIVLDPLAENIGPFEQFFSAKLDIGADVNAAGRNALIESRPVGAGVIDLKVLTQSGHADIAGLSAPLEIPADIRETEAGIDVLSFNKAAEDSEILAGSGPLQRESEIQIVAVQGHPADLDVAEKHHSGRAPELQSIGG